MKEFLDSEVVSPACRDAIQQLITTGDTLAGFENLESEPLPLPASSIQHQPVNDVTLFFGLDYWDANPRYLWDISDNGPTIPSPGNRQAFLALRMADHQMGIIS